MYASWSHSVEQTCIDTPSIPAAIRLWNQMLSLCRFKTGILYDMVCSYTVRYATLFDMVCSYAVRYATLFDMVCSYAVRYATLFDMVCSYAARYCTENAQAGL
ncbi:hypothetical protein DPMN_149525 [Dreissena polymorpha]|uniref:Uncharacterized protein n=1 Tax=Dreissena polymorpha TaxID=45954 RepID=A0A9D4FHJ6_DREPO|nr:hypothetical protein DPMN_149525 [Dreissena polymorpha]